MAWENSVTVASGPNDAALTLSAGKPVAPASGTIDGINWSSLTTNVSRVLLLNQAGSPGVTAVSNGVWIYKGLSTAMARPASPDPYFSGGTLDNQTVTRVQKGTAFAHTQWACVTQGTLTVDMTAIAHSRQSVHANAKNFGATGDGSTDDSTALNNAANSITSGGLTLPPGTYKATSALTTPSGAQVMFEEGAVLSPSSAGVTISGHVEAHPMQPILDRAATGTNVAGTHTGSGTGTVSFTGNPVANFQGIVKIIGGGSFPITFQYSLDGAVNYSKTITTGSSSPWTYAIPGTGVTLNFSPTTGWVANDTYAWTSTAPMTVNSTMSDRANVRWWGAKGDTKVITDAQVSGGTGLVSTSANFTQADVGKRLVVATPLSAATGTVTVNNGSTTIVGSGTHFTTEIAIGQIVTINNGGTFTDYLVTAITSDTQLTVAVAPTAAGASLTMYRTSKLVTTITFVTDSSHITMGSSALLTHTTSARYGTDDTAAFQRAAFAAAYKTPTGASAAPNGLGVVYIPQGTYTITASVVCHAAVLFLGLGGSPGGITDTPSSFATILHDFIGDLFVFDGMFGAGPASGGGVERLRIVQACNVGTSAPPSTGGGSAILVTAVDGNHRPSWVKIRNVTIEESGAMPWTWAVSLAGFGSMGLDNIRLTEINSHTGAGASGAIQIFSCNSVKVISCELHDAAATISIDGDFPQMNGIRTVGVQILGGEGTAIALNYASQVSVIGGSYGQITTTGNTLGPNTFLPEKLTTPFNDTSGTDATGVFWYDASGLSNGYFRFSKPTALPNSKYYGGITAAGTAAKYMLGLDPNDAVRIAPNGDAIVAIGPISSFSGASNGDAVLSHGAAIRAVSNSGAATFSLVDSVGASDYVRLGNGAAGIQWMIATRSLGGGAAPTLGTIGGSGPASAAQSGWIEMVDSSGAKCWVPCWK